MATKISAHEANLLLQAGPVSNSPRESNPQLESQHRSRKRDFSYVENDFSVVSSKKSKHTSFQPVPESSGKTRRGLSNRSQGPASASGLSKLPMELAEVVFDYHDLNPLQLMTLLGAKKSDGTSSSVSLLASRNEYWAPYAPQIQNSETVLEGYYAQQFIERYQIMPPGDQGILNILYTGTIEEKDEIVDKILGHHLASAWKSCDIVREVLEFRAFNPVQMMTLLSDKNSDGSLSNVSLVARRNKYWASFAPQGEKGKAIPEGYHAQQFMGRYQTMPFFNKEILQTLWTGTSEEKNEIVRRMMELPLASAWKFFDIVRAVVSIDGQAWLNAPHEISSDREIVLAAVKQNSEGIWDYIPQELEHDREIVLAAVKQDGEMLEAVPNHLQRDREIVLTAVEQNGWALFFAHEDLQDDREIVLAAVKQNGEALEYASDDLQRDPELRALAGWPPLG